MSNKYPGGIITSGANAGYSVAFDGTGDYLQAGSNAALAPGSGNFTLEFFVYPVGSANFMGLYQNYTDGLSRSTAFRISINGTDNTSLVVQTQASALITTSTGVMTANAWNHVALVRNGSGSNNLVLYVNGVSRGTATNTTNFSDGFAQIGNTIYNGTNYTWNGYISNFRLVVGTALYTAAFTPPTQLFAITNTSLLTCNSPAIVDQSSNAFTITANGNAAVSTFTPFQGYVAYNPALGAATPGIWTVSDAIQAAQTRRWNMYDPYFNYTTLLLHGNGTNGAQNNTFLDSSSNNFTITRNGNTTQGTFSPFSQTGWSNYFDGTSNSYLTAPDNTAYDVGSGDFVLEGWVYLTASTDYGVIAGQWGIPRGYALRQRSGKFQFTFVTSAAPSTEVLVDGTTSYSLNTWYHVAVIRTGSTIGLFVNGTREATNTSSPTINNSTDVFSVGRAGNAADYTTGYISNVRLVKGSNPSGYSATSSTLTVPTAALTAVTGTSILTCQSNRFVDNSTTAATITSASGVSVQPFSPFYPLVAYTPQAQGGSGYFDGTGDYLTAANNAAFLFGTGDFTVEAWVYPTALSGSTNNTIACVWATSQQAWFLGINSSNTVIVGYGSGGSSGSSTFSYTFTTNQWYHIAVTRSGTNLKVFVNGTQAGATVTNSTNITSTASLSVGANLDAGPTQYWNGYISGLRVLKGTAQYTANFTVPTSPPTNITNTSFLNNYTNAGIVDSTAKNVLETVGNAQISTTQSKFGGSSMYFDGTGDRLYFADGKAYVNGTEPFTLECWVNLGGTPNFWTIFGSSSSNGLLFTVQSLTAVIVNPSGLGNTVSGTTSLTAGTWFHLALTRNSANRFDIWVNGASIGNATSTQSFGTPTMFVIGAADNSGGQQFNGYLDDVRISKFCRYTGTFTPQTSQWQDQ